MAKVAGWPPGPDDLRDRLGEQPAGELMYSDGDALMIFVLGWLVGLLTGYLWVVLP